MRTFAELIGEDAVYDKTLYVERRQYALRMRELVAKAADPKTWLKFQGIHSTDHLLAGLHEAEALQCEAAPIMSEFVVRMYPHQMEVEQMQSIQQYALDAGAILRKYGVDECADLGDALDAIGLVTPGGVE